MDSNLKLIPLPESFQKDAHLGLLKTQLELLKMGKRFSALVVSEAKNRINQAWDDDVYEKIDKNIELVSLTSGILHQKLDVYQYHFGKDQDYLKIQESFAVFEAEHDFLLDEFINWLEGVEE